MKNKFINLFLLLIVSFVLTSCGEVVIENPTNNPGDDPNLPIVTPPSQTVEGIEYKVSLLMDKKIYIPKENEVITVYWQDDFSQYSAQIDNTGYATINLDGDFNIYLDKTPKDYTYDPNIYQASNDNPHVEIELLRVSRPTNGKGTDAYNCFKITNEGVYTASLKKINSKVFYEYYPSKNGYYYIESMFNIYDDTVNPLIDTYNGTSEYKSFNQTIDGGGTSAKEGYTKNFRWVIRIAEESISGASCFTFAVRANSSTGVYPIDINFKITYVGEYLIDPTLAKLMEAKEANFKTPEYDKSKYTYINSNGGVGSYYQSGLNGSKIIDGSKFKYNEATGYYHVYDKATDTYGPILCAKITQPCAYYESALSVIEYAGNKALTVSNGTENYKQFIEIEYAACCNGDLDGDGFVDADGDGVCYVTEELKEFLQKFSISEKLFMDGGGFIEGYTGVFVSEEDQWLFACGYYQEK